ncbi:MAG: hypothetical protein V4507_08235 [Verrucomicrobiota bacterium]
METKKTTSSSFSKEALKELDDLAPEKILISDRTNPYEVEAFNFLKENKIKIPGTNLLQKQFNFYCDILPRFSITFANFYQNKDGRVPLSMLCSMAYFISWKRWGKEMSFCGMSFEKYFKLLNKPGQDSEIKDWFGKFFEWFDFFLKAVHYWTEKQSRDISSFQGDKKQAAQWGTITYFSNENTSSHIQSLLTEYNDKEPNLLETFSKNRNNPKKQKATHLDVDCWLMEIWPLVLHFELNFSDLHKIIGEKFHDEENLRVHFETSEALNKHCKQQLFLSLHPSAQKKSGRPKESKELSPVQEFIIGFEVWDGWQFNAPKKT